MLPAAGDSEIGAKSTKEKSNMFHKSKENKEGQGLFSRVQTEMVITPFRNLVLCADSRREMEEWILALRSAASREFYEANAEHREMLSGHHNWYACSHARPTYCNVCRDTLSGVTSHGLSCEVCKFKVHKRCAVKASSCCKWTTLASIGRDIIEEEDGMIAMPHQWLEGNLPVSAKCCVCDKTCGSVLRLQDWRCLWCKSMVHAACKASVARCCSLGHCRISILPPTAISNLDSDGFWRAHKLPGTSPLLVFVNSKSGDNQGVKMLRKFKQLLNPAQVFDLTNGGPKIGLRLYQSFDSFRVLVCGGDGSIGWVLNEIDTLGLHKQCQVGVLPLGTGNDLARVLGWGAAFDDDTQLPVTLEKLEHAQIKMLDRWSIKTYEGNIMPPSRRPSQQCDFVTAYEDSVADHLSQILQSENHNVVISSAKILCETIKEFMARVGQQVTSLGSENHDDSISHKCDVVNEKLDALLDTLNAECDAYESRLRCPRLADPPRGKTARRTQQGRQPAADTHPLPPENYATSPGDDSLPPEDDPLPPGDYPLPPGNDSLPPGNDSLPQANDSLPRGNDPLPPGNDLLPPGNDSLPQANDSLPPGNEPAGNDAPPLGNDLLPPENDALHLRNDMLLPSLYMRQQEEESVELKEESEIQEKDLKDFTNERLMGGEDTPGYREGGPFDLGKDSSDLRDGSSYVREGQEFSEGSVTIKEEPVDSREDSVDPRKDSVDPSKDSVDPRDGSLCTKEFSLNQREESMNPGEDCVSTGDDISNHVKPATQSSEETVNLKGSPSSLLQNMVGVEVNQASEEDEEAICSIIVTAAENWHGDEVMVSVSQLEEDLKTPSLNQEALCVRPKMATNTPKPKEQLMSRANSLKKAIRQIIEHTERVVDEQNQQTADFPQATPHDNHDFLVTPSSPLMASDILITVNDDTITPLPSPLLVDEGEVDEDQLPTMSTLVVPSFLYSSSSDGESSACSTPGSLSPVRGRSPEMRRKHSASVSPQPPKSPSSSHRRASRRLSSMSAFCKNLVGPLSMSGSKEKKQEVELPVSPTSLTMDVPVFPMLPSGSVGTLSSHLPSKTAGGSFISQVLLANADALCAAASPLMAEDVDIDQYQERCVMNNYFGIGLDAKISLEFHQKREEHPEKCRSRTKNLMWYGVIGSKEMVNRSFKNLEQKVQLECDGHRIPLPNLQGIVVLNIASYMGGTNFWGSSKEDTFTTPSFDDKILEVVAVFGSVQLGMSRVLNLQRHRIAQCRSVKITIMGEEGVPVQVDGEAWIQPPGHIRILHKNRAQMLTKDKVFEEALKTWTEKQKIERPVGPRQHTLSDAETCILQTFVEATEVLIRSVKVASICHSSVEVELFHLATQASGFLDRLYPAGKLTQPAIRTHVSDLVSSVRTLYNETRIFLAEKGQALHMRSEVEEKLKEALHDMECEMKKVYDIGGLPHFQAIEQEATELHQLRRKEKSKVSLMSRLLGKKAKSSSKDLGYTGPSVFNVLEWGVEEVGRWLESLGMAEYRGMFSSHDVRGQELLCLGRADLKDLGIHKVGHLKRIQQGLKDIKSKMSLLDKTATVL